MNWQTLIATPVLLSGRSVLQAASNLEASSFACSFRDEYIYDQFSSHNKAYDFEH